MAKMVLKRKIGKIWPESRNQNRKIILLYHSVGKSVWSLSLCDFCEQINWLYDHCELMSLTDLIKSKPSCDMQVALTFDDGYANLYENVAEKLAEKKIFPTLYLNTGWIGEAANQRKQSQPELGHYPDESFLTWHEVRELGKAGWEIGSHGVNHCDFTCQEPDVIKKELRESKRDIESHLSKECSHFSYPWGRHSKQVKQAVKKAGYAYAVGGRHAAMGLHADLLALPRINIANEYSHEDFKAILKGKWDYLGLIHQLKGLCEYIC